jgi:hypothetical protein
MVINLQLRELILLREAQGMLGPACAHTYRHAWLQVYGLGSSFVCVKLKVCLDLCVLAHMVTNLELKELIFFREAQGMYTYKPVRADAHGYKFIT